MVNDLELWKESLNVCVNQEKERVIVGYGWYGSNGYRWRLIRISKVVGKEFSLWMRMIKDFIFQFYEIWVYFLRNVRLRYGREIQKGWSRK